MLRLTGLRWSCAFTHLIQMAIFFLGSHEYKQPSCEKINACVCCGQSTASYVLQQGPKKSTAAFLTSKSFLHESDKDKKSWQRRLAIKIHLCPIRARTPITKIVMTCAGNKTPDVVDFWAGHCLRQKLKLILMEMIYSLNGNTVPGICPKGLKPMLPRQTDCLAARWSMLVWWAHLMKSPICIQV